MIYCFGREENIVNAYIYIKDGPQLIVTNLKSIKSKQGNTSISETTDFSACFFGHKNYIFTGDNTVSIDGDNIAAVELR